MTNNYYQKKKKESFEKKHVNDIKIFLKKRQKSHEKDIKKLVKEEKNIIRIFLRNKRRN